MQHLCHIFGCMFCFWVFCNITYPVFYSNSRSWPHLAACGHSWFHRAPQTPHFPKCPSSKTSICEHFYLVQIHDSFKNAPNTKTRFVRKCPYYKTLDSLSAPRKAKHCIAIGLWPWPGWALTWFAQGWRLGCGLGLPGHLPGLPRAGSWAGLPQRRLLVEASRTATAHEISNPAVRKFQKRSARACGHENFQLSRQRVSRGFVPEGSLTPEIFNLAARE